MFLNSVERFRTPMRLRTDHGTENVLIARYMLEKHGVEARPVITGKSVHNQRIERLWVDVFIAERAERSEAAEPICHLSAWCKVT